jgi:hypothetical protein
MTIAAFGWHDYATPYINTANLEAMLQAAGAYTDTAAALLIPLTQKAAASGVAPLDSNSRLPVANLPLIELGSVATPAYSASITPNAAAGSWQTITVTNGTAFTINAPTNPPTSSQTQQLAVEVLNSSGGAMGVITWNGAFIFASGAWTNPASTKKRFAYFDWNGLAWICTSIATSDY